jgi:hypothetical protein
MAGAALMDDHRREVFQQVAMDEDVAATHFLQEVEFFDGVVEEGGQTPGQGAGPPEQETHEEVLDYVQAAVPEADAEAAERAVDKPTCRVMTQQTNNQTEDQTTNAAHNQ